MSASIEERVRSCRTFAIISHPDAGKTTLTEKLLLYGGAIHLAGNVKAKKNQKNTTSDWMELERQRGISVSTTCLRFSYSGYAINLLDTPGHKDFSEDTYRTLVAADAAVMLIDAAKGVEPQTRKLFEVCRMRGLPIFTFINKMDRPSREPLDLLDELEQVLGIRSSPMTWPIGRGDQFRGVFDRGGSEFLLFDSKERAQSDQRVESISVKSAQDPKLKELLLTKRLDAQDAESILGEFHAELELLEVAGDAFEKDRVLKGELTPVFFGSAISNFGVESFLKQFLEIAPPPGNRTAYRLSEKSSETIESDDQRFSAFVFKILANMDPNHRDRVAFIRVCSGKMKRNSQVWHSRLKKKIKLAMPVQFFGQEREVIEEAFPGDIVGVLDSSGDLRIGDTLAEGTPIAYAGIPQFSPEHFSGIEILDPLKRKQLKKGLDQLAEEGVVQVYAQRGLGDKDPIIGAVGALQLDVLRFRLLLEYKVEIRLVNLAFTHARWIRGEAIDLSLFDGREDTKVVLDRDQRPVVLFKSEWSLNYAVEKHSDLEFSATADATPVN